MPRDATNAMPEDIVCYGHFGYDVGFVETITRARRQQKERAVLVLIPDILEDVSVDHYVLTVLELEVVLDVNGLGKTPPFHGLEEIVVLHRNAVGYEIVNRLRAAIDTH